MGLCRYLLLLAVLAFKPLPAQQTSPWQGEWGHFSAPAAAEGQRLSISNCQGNACHFLIETLTRAGNSGTAGDATLVLTSATAATANLPGASGKDTCTLHFLREAGTPPAIRVSTTGASCTTYYSTDPTVSMAGSYPQRALIQYSGEHADQCFLDSSPALLATCTHPELAALEQQWEFLAEEYPLQKPIMLPKEMGSDEMRLDAALLRSCNPDPAPLQCLTQRYTMEIAAMQAKKDAVLAASEKRGDPALGGRLALRIAGRYRHSFRNGDVNGHEYTTTDTLTITPVGPASIHFSAELNFFNGHQCNLAGGALFRQDGSFVFDDKPGNAFLPDVPACRLAIIPTSKGVQFKDITRGCRNYCGERGSWDGEGFTFQQRVPSSPAPK